MRFGGSFRFVDDPEYVEARNGTCILDGLMLRVVEISRYSHHNILYYMTQVGLSSLLHEEVDEISITNHLGSILVIVEVVSTSVAFIKVATALEVVDVRVAVLRNVIAKVTSTSVAVVIVATPEVVEVEVEVLLVGVR